MDAMVFKVPPVQSGLIPEVIVVLFIDVLDNGLPAVSVRGAGGWGISKKADSTVL